VAHGQVVSKDPIWVMFSVDNDEVVRHIQSIEEIIVSKKLDLDVETIPFAKQSHITYPYFKQRLTL
jgi:hypothetical protein